MPKIISILKLFQKERTEKDGFILETEHYRKTKAINNPDNFIIAYFYTFWQHFNYHKINIQIKIC